MNLIIRFAAIMLSLFAAAYFLPGIRVRGDGWIVYSAMAVILSIVNLVIRPVLKFFSFPLRVLTLGLFTLVINAFTFWFSSYIAVHFFNVGFYVDDFLSAFGGALIVSIVSGVISWFFEDKDHK